MGHFSAPSPLYECNILFKIHRHPGGIRARDLGCQCRYFYDMNQRRPAWISTYRIAQPQISLFVLTFSLQTLPEKKSLLLLEDVKDETPRISKSNILQATLLQPSWKQLKIYSRMYKLTLLLWLTRMTLWYAENKHQVI